MLNTFFRCWNKCWISCSTCWKQGLFGFDFEARSWVLGSWLLGFLTVWLFVICRLHRCEWSEHLVRNKSMPCLRRISQFSMCTDVAHVRRFFDIPRRPHCRHGIRHASWYSLDRCSAPDVNFEVLYTWHATTPCTQRSIFCGVCPIWHEVHPYDTIQLNISWYVSLCYMMVLS